MKKIPTLFLRPENGKLVTPSVNPECEWVIDGEGIATIKYDGSCCAVRDGKFYARYQAKTAPTPEYAELIGFVPINDDGEEGHRHGWRRVDFSPADQHHREAWLNQVGILFDWTYELVGPKVQSNPYGLSLHQLYKHGTPFIDQPPRAFNDLREWLSFANVEGIVWWRDTNDPNSDKVKIKRRDFALPWPVKA